MLNRISDVKKSEELFQKTGYEPQQFIRPRKHNEEENTNKSSNILKPNPSRKEVTVESKRDFDKRDAIKPRKKSQQNTEFANISKDELEKTVNEARFEYREIDKFTKKEEKKLEKERHAFEKKVVKLQQKVERMVDRDQFTEELTHTLEIQDNYMAAMKEINEHINKIKTDYDPEISLADRRRQIYENSKLASTERAQRLMYIRKLEAEGKSLAKGNAAPIKKESFYSKQLEQQKKMNFLRANNPYHKRLNEVNERGGITMEETMAPQDRVAQQ
ncbi:hypothetical protein Zmor_008661 [Zophobas morio]|uniref:Uncharacterized protein n=1 Tax=Zophobas morio TaxID=2755281 RepID=A0AA38LZM6_9CUCU|nr:hypothetical protein Zmor_008661 [Zophobas morio]